MRDPILEYWAEMLARTPVTPDVMTRWKRVLDQGIEAWSRALGEVMATEEFAQLLGASIEQWLAAQAPVTGDRAEVKALAAQLGRLEERLRRLEDRLDTPRESSAPGRARGRGGPATRL